MILNRLKDLVRTDRHELRTATGELMKLLLRLAALEPQDDYSSVVESSFMWGFDKVFTATWQGDQEIRGALVEAAKTANASAHAVLSKNYLKQFSDKNLADSPGWYHHDLRKIVVALLANPHCGDDADKLAELYDRLNQETH